MHLCCANEWQSFTKCHSSASCVLTVAKSSATLWSAARVGVEMTVAAILIFLSLSYLEIENQKEQAKRCIRICPGIWTLLYFVQVLPITSDHIDIILVCEKVLGSTADLCLCVLVWFACVYFCSTPIHTVFLQLFFSNAFFQHFSIHFHKFPSSCRFWQYCLLAAVLTSRCWQNIWNLASTFLIQPLQLW